VPLSALALALAAAVLHAFWNLLIARARDPEAATAVALVVALVVNAPVAAAVWRLEAPAWPYLLASALLHLAYVALLAAGYRRAELSVVYPISRGAAPVLVLVVGVAALGASTSAGQAAGVCVVALGILLVGGFRGVPDWTGIAFGFVIAGVIAAYTLVDKNGIQYAAPLAYIQIMMLLPGLGYAAALARLRGFGSLRAELTLASAAAGVATFASYALVLAALQRASAASVAAVRETSIVIAAGLAALVLGERGGASRLVGALLVVIGVALVSVS
jgi:drug/metabolite transporter (DMT)-like permease